MVATVLIRALTSTGPTVTDITSTNLRDNSFDTYTTNDTTNPIKIPAAGTNYGYWRVTRLDCTVTPATTLANIKWYVSSGSNPTGCAYIVGTATSYIQATGTPGTTGNQLSVGNYGGTFTLGNNDAIATYNSGSPLAVTGSINNPTTGQFGDRVVFQISVGTTANPGATSQVTLAYQYDES